MYERSTRDLCAILYLVCILFRLGVGVLSESWIVGLARGEHGMITPLCVARIIS